MADGAVGSDVLESLIDRVVAAGEQEKITLPRLVDMEKCDIFRGPVIELVERIQ